MTASRIWLHIGTEKTGTTSIQALLADNRAALAERGVLYPAAPGQRNHLGLAAYAQDDAIVNDLRHALQLGDPASLAPFRARLEQGLADEIGRSGAHSIVFSNEHCSSRLHSVGEIARLKRLLDPFAAEIVVVVYLRNQVDLLASWYSTAIKGGATSRLRWPQPEGMRRMLDYAALLERWEAVFGRERMVVRRFVAADFAGGDLLTDFAETIGLEKAGDLNKAGLRLPGRANESLDLERLGYLREVNRHVKRVDGQADPMRGPMHQMLDRVEGGGGGFMLSRAVAEEVVAACTASNAAVSARYFGGRHDPLFPPAKAVGDADYAGEPPTDPVAVARVAARLWRLQMARIRTLDVALRACRAPPR